MCVVVMCAMVLWMFWIWIVWRVYLRKATEPRIPTQCEYLEGTGDVREMWSTRCSRCHCNHGVTQVGRTGVFMMMNIVFDKLRRRIIPDLGAILAEIRKQRMLLVQTAMQFSFCHEAAVTFLNSTEFEYL